MRLRQILIWLLDNYVAYEIEVKTGDYVGPKEGAKIEICLVGETYNTGKFTLFTFLKNMT